MELCSASSLTLTESSCLDRNCTALLSDSDSHRAAKQIKGRSQNRPINSGTKVNLSISLSESFQKFSYSPQRDHTSDPNHCFLNGESFLHFNPSSPPHSVHSSRLAHQLCSSLICPQRGLTNSQTKTGPAPSSEPPASEKSAGRLFALLRADRRRLMPC